MSVLQLLCTWLAAYFEIMTLVETSGACTIKLFTAVIYVFFK